ncbi:MAG: hypothetical protein ACO3JL_13660 [Myxococcota bacterium]
MTDQSESAAEGELSLRPEVAALAAALELHEGQYRVPDEVMSGLQSALPRFDHEGWVHLLAFCHKLHRVGGDAASSLRSSLFALMATQLGSTEAAIDAFVAKAGGTSVGGPLPLTATTSSRPALPAVKPSRGLK